MKEGLIKIIISLILLLITIIIIVSAFIMIIESSNKVENFKNSCESFNGSFWEIANVTCAIGYSNCKYMCSLHEESFSMEELSLLPYQFQMCIKDCNYINKNRMDIQCVC